MCNLLGVLENVVFATHDGSMQSVHLRIPAIKRLFTEVLYVVGALGERLTWTTGVCTSIPSDLLSAPIVFDFLHPYNGRLIVLIDLRCWTL